MIHDRGWLALYRQAFDMVEKAYANVDSYRAALLDLSGIEVWTEAPSDRSKVSKPDVRSVEHWRTTMLRIYQFLNGLMTDHGTELLAYDPLIHGEISGILTSLASFNAPFSALLALHTSGGQLISEPLTDAQRTQLAAVFAAQLG